MSQAAIAERYARALFELAAEANQLAQVSEQMRQVADALASSSELRAVLNNPIVAESQRQGLIRDLATRLGLSATVQNTIRLLALRRRLPALPDIAKKLRELADDKAGIVRAQVTAAKPLPESYYRELVAELEKITNRKILLEKKRGSVAHCRCGDPYWRQHRRWQPERASGGSRASADRCDLLTQH